LGVAGVSPAGETLAPTNRLLPGDQVDRSQGVASLAARQAAFAALDPNISLPPLPGVTNPTLRVGRAIVNGDRLVATPGGRRPELVERSDVVTQPVSNAAAKPTGQDVDPAGSRGSAGPGPAMDAFSWWLTMFSVLANAILAYLLYDSRAKYLNLADELQSRIFREG
jgi:hypothetical protein